MYRWVDENGITRISDNPPQNQQFDRVFDTTESPDKSKKTKSPIAEENSGKKLYSATYKGNLKDVKALIENGADVNYAKENGWTALMAASSKGHIEIVEFLIDKGANLEAVSDYGETALMWALWKKRFKVVPVLLDAGASIYTKSKQGATACNIGRHHGNDEIKELLRQNGCR